MALGKPFWTGLLFFRSCVLFLLLIAVALAGPREVRAEGPFGVTLRRIQQIRRSPDSEGEEPEFVRRAKEMASTPFFRRFRSTDRTLSPPEEEDASRVQWQQKLKRMQLRRQARLVGEE